MRWLLAVPSSRAARCRFLPRDGSRLGVILREDASPLVGPFCRTPLVDRGYALVGVRKGPTSAGGAGAAAADRAGCRTGGDDPAGRHSPAESGRAVRPGRRSVAV